MDFKAAAHIDKRSKADVLVIPFVKTGEKSCIAVKKTILRKELKAPLDAGDFSGKEGEILWIYSEGGPESRIVLLGLGDSSKVDAERLRRAYGALVKGCHSRKIKQVNLLIPEIHGLPVDELMRGIAEGVLLANYSFTGMKLAENHKSAPIREVNLIGTDAKALKVVRKYAAICEGVDFARNLVNGNADDITPQHLGMTAKLIAKRHPGMKAVVFDKKRLIKEKFGLLLAVNRGSHRDPALIVVDYRGAPRSKERIVFVGKGITYDTGGLNIKPTGSMESMRADMAGAAAVLGAVVAAASIGLKRNVTVVIPSTENSIDSMSYKPGDVYSGYAGKSVEIANTDAEGRLVLADALAYAVKNLQPTYLIDLATLTGAMDVALGAELSGLFSNDEKLAAMLEHAAKNTHERVWRLPLVDEYREQLKSDIADLKNMGGKGGGSIKAALFLEEFVGKTRWAHLDIASVAYANEAKRYLSKYGTGFGVRLLVEFLENL